MVEAGMYGTWVDERGERHLVDTSQSLIVGVRNDLKDERIVYRDKAMNGVIDDLADICHEEYLKIQKYRMNSLLLAVSSS
jgi:hypothetical protein